ncbi:MAG: rhodanese-like domain-containing protein [Rhodoferax sp.]
MKFLIDNWMLITLAVVSGAMLLMPVLQGATQGGIDPGAAVQLMNREKAAVIDVCSPDEFAAGHLPGARNIPLAELEAKLATVVKNKTLPLVLVCQTGARSGRAVALARKLGYEKAQSLAGGLGAWKSANLPVEKA